MLALALIAFSFGFSGDSGVTLRYAVKKRVCDRDKHLLIYSAKTPVVSPGL